MIKQAPRIVRTSSDLAANHWMARQLPPDTSLRGYCEDRAVSLVTRAVADAIDRSGLTRSDVARALGTTRSYVSQVLNGSTNMTVKTLGAVLWACGRQVNELCTDTTGAHTRPTAHADQQPSTVIFTSGEQRGRLAFNVEEDTAHWYGAWKQSSERGATISLIGYTHGR